MFDVACSEHETNSVNCTVEVVQSHARLDHLVLESHNERVGALQSDHIAEALCHVFVGFTIAVR